MSTKEVCFRHYCPLCLHYLKSEDMEPCDDCLNYGSMEDSHKPIHFVENDTAKKKETKK